jgi:hypothetical protein
MSVRTLFSDVTLRASTVTWHVDTAVKPVLNFSRYYYILVDESYGAQRML